MKRNLKSVLCGSLICYMALGSTMTSFAGTWKNGAGDNQSRWWYDNEDGTYANNNWQWIDGNGDGVAECYYFDADGWMLANTTTPDGHQVNESGAWVENGVVKTNKATQPVQNQPKGISLCKEDFIVSGDNEVVRTTSDHSVISCAENFYGFNDGRSWIYTFNPQDSMMTARGITPSSKKADVLNAYGGTAIEYTAYGDDISYWGKEWDVPDIENVEKAVSSVEYYIYTDNGYGVYDENAVVHSTDGHAINFYFDENDNIVLIAYYYYNW